jgi:hypothetical protein
MGKWDGGLVANNSTPQGKLEIGGAASPHLRVMCKPRHREIRQRRTEIFLKIIRAACAGELVRIVPCLDAGTPGLG